MLRYEDLNDISDGRLYSADDKALLGTNGCKNCSYCCQSDMGSSIVLTPYDAYNLTKASGMSFDDMLVKGYIAISMIDDIAQPHLKMDDGCRFLTDGRCSVHAARPGICRLFPLGRIYKDKGFDYILQKGQCICEYRTPVLIDDWLGIEDRESYDSYIIKWHGFLKFEQKRTHEIREMAGYEISRLRELDDKEITNHAIAVGDYNPEDNLKDEDTEPFVPSDYRESKYEELELGAEDRIREIMKAVLSMMFMQNYEADSDRGFYEEFNNRLKGCFSEIRKL